MEEQPELPAAAKPFLKPIEKTIADYRVVHPAAKPTAIGEALGVSTRTVSAALKSTSVRAYLAELFDKAGATLQASAKVVAEAHDASKIKFFSEHGVVTDERTVIDYKTRLEAAKLNLEARGILKEAPVQQQNNFINLTDEQLAMIATKQARAADFIEASVV